MQNKKFGIRRSKEPPICCNERMEQLESKSPSEVLDDLLIDYKITGGYDENTVEVFWKIKKEGISIYWIYLRTFTGGQLKYVINPQKTSFVFALAEGPFEQVQKEIEVTNKLPKKFFDLSIENDLYRCCLPEQYGGWGLSETQILQVQEEFSRGPGGTGADLHT